MARIKTPNSLKAIKAVDHFIVRTEQWRITKVRLGSMYSYFRYAEIQVVSSGKEWAKLHKNNRLQARKYLSCSIASYGHMKSCINFALDIASSLNISTRTFNAWLNEMKNKRDRIAAHPNEKNYDSTIMVYEAVLSRSGIRFPLWDQNLRKADDRTTVILTPVEDLARLADFIEMISSATLLQFRSAQKKARIA